MANLYEIILYLNDDRFFRLGYYTDEYLEIVKRQLTKVYKWLQTSEAKGWRTQTIREVHELTGIPKAHLMCKFLDACINTLPEDWIYSEAKQRQFNMVFGVLPEYKDKALKAIFYQTIKHRNVNDL